MAVFGYEFLDILVCAMIYEMGEHLGKGAAIVYPWVLEIATSMANLP